MSTYEREWGTLKLSVKEYGPLKKFVRDAYNARQNGLFKTANRLAAIIKEQGKGKRGFDFHEALFSNRQFRTLDEESAHAIENAIFRQDTFFSNGPMKVYMPRRKDFPLKTSRDNCFEVGECGFKFFDKSRQLVWDSGDNNHAVDRAHEIPFVERVFSYLGRINWTRGTGGFIMYENEYMEEDGIAPSSNYNYGPKKF